MSDGAPGRARSTSSVRSTSTVRSSTRVRSTSKGQQTRARIVEVAADVIHRRGVSATSIGDVRVAADVSSSQLYHYFSDKQDLVRAVVEHQAAAVVEGQRALGLSTLEAFRQWKNDLVTDEDARHGGGGCPLGSLGADLAETDPTSREAIALGFQRWAAVIATGLSDMRDSAILPADTDTHRLATGILATLQGGLLLGQVERTAAPLEAALSTVLALLEALSGGRASFAGVESV